MERADGKGRRTIEDPGQRNLSRFRCDILGISETHRTGTEELNLEGYKFIGQGRTDDIHRAGVGFLLSRSAQKALLEYKPTSERMISITLRTSVGKATIVPVY